MFAAVRQFVQCWNSCQDKVSERLAIWTQVKDLDSIPSMGPTLYLYGLQFAQRERAAFKHDRRRVLSVQSLTEFSSQRSEPCHVT